MLTGGADPMEATCVPPEGFFRLAPVARQAPGDHRRGVRPGAGVDLSFLVAIGAALASLQTLIPWAPWRAVMQAAGALVMFGGLGIWARLTRGGMAAGPPCACERPPVWIRVIPSVAQDRHPLGESLLGDSLDGAGARRPDRRAALVEANGVTRS
jgi:hypothetical protein